MKALMPITDQVPMLTIPDLISLFLSGRSPATISAYQTDLANFARFFSLPDGNQAAQALLANGPGHANRLAIEYRTAMVDRGLSPAAVNRKLATLRSLTKMARTTGLITWALDVENVKVTPYRDTRGPTQTSFHKMLDKSAERTDAKGVRDRAILYLLHDLALRRGELVALDLSDVNLGERTVHVRGKGKIQKQSMTLPARTLSALAEWVAIRGNEPGPLFVNFHLSERIAGKRLTATSVYRIIQEMGNAVKTRTTPHGLRHRAITTAVVRAQNDGIGLEKVQHFSRHANLKTLQVYLDRHQNWQGRVAELVAR